MSADSGVDERGSSSLHPNVIELRKIINELTSKSQELVTEKLFLENEVNQLKKRSIQIR